MQRLDSMDKPAVFFDVCAGIEGLCAELYHFYSEIFADDHEVSNLWQKTAVEEENHQRQFELVKRISEEISFDICADIERINQIHTKLGALLTHVRQSPPDLVTALKKAIDMEEDLANLHLDSSVRFHDESVRSLFQALRAFDMEHVQSLKLCLTIKTLSQSEMNG